MSEIERPDWAYDGAEVYTVRTGGWSRKYTPKARTVVRATATQLVVETDDGDEERYRIKDLRRVGGSDVYNLIPPTAPAVVAARRERLTRDAMEDLRAIMRELEVGAQLGNDDHEVALENATLIRDAAVKAVDLLKQID